LVFSAAAILLSGPAFAQSDMPVKQGQQNVPEFDPAFPQQTRAPASDSGVEVSAEIFAGPLVHPWGIDAIPGGGYLVTERLGRLRFVSQNGELSEPVEGLPDVLAQKQGGLLDVRVGPDFEKDRMIYWTYSKPMGNGRSATAAARGKLAEDRLRVTDVEDIFVQEPPSPTPMHYGSRILFDGKGHAFITTGEHFTEEERPLAQDLGSTYGKIVRVNLDGSIPKDNPYVRKEGAIDSVWSLGHRNIQGAAFEPGADRLWVVEHGPQGGDELNLIRRGANYGWPLVSYGQNYDGSPVGTGKARHTGDFVEPRYYWDPVIAPGGAIFYQGQMFAEWKGDLLISSLTPGALVRLELKDDTVVGEERLLRDKGRIRDIVEAPDGALLVLVDARKGSVLRLTPARAHREPK
jgi:glucose/arabinose dehydrogenase